MHGTTPGGNAGAAGGTAARGRSGRPRCRPPHHGRVAAGGGAARIRPGLLVPALLVAVAGSALSACGYTLAGRGSFLPDYIETVAIPMFDNNTAVFDVEQLLTQEVRTAFISRGSYRVQTDTAGADATLSGTIRDIRIAPASFSADQQASRYVFTLQASIEFRDMTTNEIVWDDPQMIFSDEYEVASGVGDIASVSTFFGQQANTVERLAVDFATTVVSSILEAF